MPQASMAAASSASAARPDQVARTVSGSTPYMPALDGLRALSILLVVLSHLGLGRVLPGAFGVTLFFFISGYLITRQLLDRLYAGRGIGLGGFYLRRALRLMPTALSYIVISGLLYRAAGGQIGPAAWLSALFYGANYYDLWAGYASTLPHVRHPFNILWSLAIEEHFYLLWPVMLALLWRAQWLPAAILCGCAAGLAWRLLLFHACFPHSPSLLCAPQNPNPVWQYNQLYLSTGARLDSIAWGVLLACGERRHAAWARISTRSAAAPALALLALALAFALPGAFARTVLRTTLQGAALLFLVPALLHRDTAMRRALSARPAIALGRLSYALYLWHWGALAFADWAAPGKPLLWLSIAAPLSFLLAASAYFGIERPMLGLRRSAGSQVQKNVLF